jgi:preprotein translocase subunit YajC
MPLPVLFAQEETTTTAATGTPEGGGKATPPPGGMMGGLLFPLALFALFYFVVIFPMSRRQKKEQATIMASMKRGTKVATASGIIGTIVNIKDGEDEVVIRSEDAKIRVLRSAVTRVLGQDENDAKS